MSKKTKQKKCKKKEVFEKKLKQKQIMWQNKCHLLGASKIVRDRFTSKFVYNKDLLKYLEQNKCAFKWLLCQLETREANKVQPEILDLMKSNITDFSPEQTYTQIIKQKARLCYPEDYAGDFNTIKRYKQTYSKLIQSLTDKNVSGINAQIYKSYTEYIFSFTTVDELDKTFNDIQNLIDEIEFHKMQPSLILKSDIDARMPGEALDYLRSRYYLSKTHFKNNTLKELAEKVSSHDFKKPCFALEVNGKKYKIVEISVKTLSSDKTEQSITGFGELGDEVQYEASMQRNCLFDIHLQSILKGKKTVYSVRNEMNVPLVTISVVNKKLSEAKARGNSIPPNFLFAVCVKLFEHLGINYKSCCDYKKMQRNKGLHKKFGFDNEKYSDALIMHRLSYGYVFKHKNLFGVVSFSGKIVIQPKYARVKRGRGKKFIGYKNDGTWCYFD